MTQLDPGNAEANTDLALLAFEVGRARQARTMVDRALATNPKYPEGLYVRGLIDLMGLRQPAAAVRDLNAYLAAAPYGSHRTDAVTLIALARHRVTRDRAHPPRAHPLRAHPQRAQLPVGHRRARLAGRAGTAVLPARRAGRPT